MIRYVIGDATAPVGDGPKIIAHVCNDAGGWGAGFVLALSRRDRNPERVYRDSGHRLDTVSFANYGDPESRTIVANMVAQHGFGEDGEPPIRYPVLRECLREVALAAIGKGASIHMPRIGCGLAGGRWEEVSGIVEEACRGVLVTVYDLAPVPGTEYDSAGDR